MLLNSDEDEYNYGKNVNYIVMEKINGVCLREIDEKVLKENENCVIKKLGEFINELHSITIDEKLIDIGGDFDKFMNERIDKCMENHKKWKVFTTKQMEMIMKYISSFVIDEDNNKSCLIHADLTEDHVFVHCSQLNGVIDWGDSRLGSPFYELIALFFGAFQSNKRRMIMFLDSYEWNKKFPKYCYKSKKFTYKCMCYSILHEFNVLCGCKELIKSYKTIEEIENCLWNLN